MAECDRDHRFDQLHSSALFTNWSCSLLKPVTTTQLALALGGLMATLFFGAMYIVQAPRVLLGHLLSSLDAWFVTFQFTVVTIGVCDTVDWDQRSFLVFSMWVWCHWAMILDTLTPLTRRRLCFERWFARLVLATLLTYPVVVTYWIFCSGGPNLRNRVLLRFSLFSATVQLHSYSLLVSRVWTVWFWMGRFLWREVFRPADAFKLLKFPVQYRVDVAEDRSKPMAIHPNTPRWSHRLKTPASYDSAFAVYQ